MRYMATPLSFLMLTLCLFAVPTASQAVDAKHFSTGQTVYAPAYSHIYSGNKEVHSLLAVTLSIRNTDPNHPIEVLSVEYYDTKGISLKKYLSSSLVLNALETTRYTISQGDKSGGSGANFIVKWKSQKPVNIPIIETIMIGSRSSFTSRGQEIFQPNENKQ